MANQRLMNCDFFLKGAFDDVSSNKAKLLYFYFFINADDYGFVGNSAKIIKSLNEQEEDNNALVQYTYEIAANELVDRGFLFKFTDKHQNNIYLIRHFFIHNKYNSKYCTTNYLSFRAKVELVDGCWELKENHLRKENKENQQINNANNTNQDNKSNDSVIEEKVDDDKWKQEWDKTMQELNGIPSESNKQKPFYELEDIPDSELKGENQ